MDRRALYPVVAVLAVVVLLLVAVVVVMPTVFAQRSSHYEYTATVETNETLSDVTLYLPVPSGPDGVLADGVTVRGPDGTELDADVEVVDTDRGPMLAVSVDELAGDPSYVLFTYDDDGRLVDRREISESEIPDDMTDRKLQVIPSEYTVTVWTPSEPAIETRDPVGNAYTLSPRATEETVPCDDPFVEETESCTRYVSHVYAEYATGSDDVVHVTVEFAAWNEWGWGFSNSYNAFDERVWARGLVGNQSGWIPADGTMHAGEGNYPTRGRSTY